MKIGKKWREKLNEKLNIYLIVISQYSIVKSNNHSMRIKFGNKIKITLFHKTLSVHHEYENKSSNHTYCVEIKILRDPNDDDDDDMSVNCNNPYHFTLAFTLHSFFTHFPLCFCNLL